MTKTSHKSSVSRLRLIVLTGVFAAFTAACSVISFPLPFTPVPMNLGLLAVFMAGVILGPKYGPLSQVVYLSIGAVGIPVFANFNSGLGVLIGPTGGYLVGYVAAAWLIGLISNRFKVSGSKQLFIYGLAILSGILVCYTLGVAWLIHLSKTQLPAALLLYAAPYIPGDLIKMTVAVFFSNRLRTLPYFD